MSFIAFEAEPFSNNLNAESITPDELIDTGTFEQRDCFRTVTKTFKGMSFLAPYRGPKVRRPLSGIQLKQESHAYMSVVNREGNELLLHNGVGSLQRPSSGSYRQGLRDKYYTDFILAQVTETRQEKAQVIDTFGDSYVFLFGERPRMLQVQGVLLNTHDFNWRSEFWQNYDENLRGTRCVENNARLYLSWDDIIVEGYILQASARENAQQPYIIPLTLTIFVTNYMSMASLLNSVWDRLWRTAGKEGIAPPHEMIGALEQDIQSMVTGEAILVSQSLREWMVQNEQPSQLESTVSFIVETAKDFIKDPWSSTKKFLQKPFSSLETASKYLPEGWIPNELCYPAQALEGFVSDITGRWNAVTGALDNITSAASDLSKPKNIAKMIGGAKDLGDQAKDAGKFLDSLEWY